MEASGINPFPLLSFLACAAYLYLGIYVLRLNRRSRLNINFFFLCCSFATWSFTYSMINFSSTQAEINFWYDVGSIGWCTVPAVMLQFMLELTQRPVYTKIRWATPFFYVPALAMIIKENTGRLTFSEFELIRFGWAPYPPQEPIWLYLFMTYYILFIGTGVLLTFLWGLSSTLQQEKKQSLILAVSTAATLTLSLVTDIVFPVLGIRVMPPLAPFFILIWAAAMWISIIRYRFMALTPSAAADEIIYQMQDFLILLNPDRTIGGINHQTERDTGFSIKDLRGRELSVLIDDTRAVEERISTLQENGGEPTAIRASLRTKSDETIPVSLAISEIRATRERTIGYTIIAHDLRETITLQQEITARGMTEKALRDSEIKFKLLTESISDVIWTMDMKTNLTYCSPAIKNLSGHLMEEIMPMKPYDYLTKESYDRCMTILTDELKREGNPGVDPSRTLHADVEYMKKDGGTVWCEVNAKFLRNETGAPVAILGVSRDIAERKLAEQKLKESEAKWRELVETSPDVIFMVNPSGVITYVGPNFEIYSGHPVNEIIGKHFKEFLPPEHIKQLADQFLKNLSNRQTTLVETAIVFNDGIRIPIELNLRTLFDETGNATARICVARDIRERMDSQKKLRDNEALFRQITENMTDMVTMVDRQGNYIFVSPSVTAVLGYDPVKMLGSTPFERIHPDERAIVEAEFQAGIRDKKSRRMEFRFRRADGEYLWIDTIGNVITDENGEVTGAVFSSRDITEKKILDLALKENETRYRTILDSIENGYYEVNLQGDLVFFNDYFMTLMGYSREELKGMNYSAFMEKATAAKVFSVFSQTYRDGTTSKGFDWEMIRKDGSIFIVETTMSLVRNADGEPTGFRGILRDVSERKRYLQALQESEERYRYIVDEAGDIIFLIDTIGAITFINQTVKKILHYDESELIGKKWWDFIDERYRNDTRHFYKLQTTEGLPTTYNEVPVKAKDGKLVWFGQTIQMLISNGRIQGYHGIARDITERVNAQTLLSESEERYRLITETMWDMIVMINNKGILTYVSPSHIQLGYKPEDLLGKNPFDLVHPDDRNELAMAMSKGIETGSPTWAQFRFLTRNGDYRWMESNGNIQKTATSDEYSIVISTRDITERKITETALHTSEQALRDRNEIMERDLRNAQIIQHALLPYHIPYLDRLIIDYRYYPLEAVGGDYFTFADLAEGGLGCFIGDVCGHGVTAALFLSLVKATVDRICRIHGQEPMRFISNLNKELIDYMTDYYITALYGYFNTDQKQEQLSFTFSKAGHPYPILYRAESGTAEFLKSRGTILGKFHEVKYTEMKIPLNPGDRIFLYTDGLPEAVTEEKQVLGYDMLRNLIQELSPGNSLTATIDLVLQRINRFRNGAPLDDDLMIIGFETK